MMRKFVWYHIFEDKELRKLMYLALHWNKEKGHLEHRLGSINGIIDDEVIGNTKFCRYNEKYTYEHTILHRGGNILESWLEAIVWKPNERKVVYGIVYPKGEKKVNSLVLQDEMKEDI
jgi:hypothetical protein